MNGLIEKEDDDLLKEIHDRTLINDGLTQRQKIVVGHVSPHFLSYLLAVATVLNRSICPADSLSLQFPHWTMQNPLVFVFQKETKL